MFGVHPLNTDISLLDRYYTSKMIYEIIFSSKTTVYICQTQVNTINLIVLGQRWSKIKLTHTIPMSCQNHILVVLFHLPIIHCVTCIIVSIYYNEWIIYTHWVGTNLMKYHL